MIIKNVMEAINMASPDMMALGSQASVIRDLFAYGQEQAAKIGKLSLIHI